MSNSAILEHPSAIAVVGLAGRFPGSRNVAEFWRNLCEGVESVTFFSAEELLASGVNPAVLHNPDYVRASATLDDTELFDAAFFNFTRKEAEITNPQQRLMLECVWEALESASCDPETYKGAIGVFGGMSSNGYQANIYSHPDIVKAQGASQVKLGNDKDFFATRISYKLNLRGPSFTVQTACSTSLVAVHLACQSLLQGECDVALAGGASIGVPQRVGYFYLEGGINSPDGHCRAFDAKAQGTIGGNGVGVVVLKRLETALADGDNILAVIRGSAVNNDGSFKIGYSAPSIDGQSEVISEALAVAGVSPETVTYVEAHGTGTPLGDPIEMAALTQAFRATTEKKNFCAVGAVKSNIGHLDAAAGVAGLIKTVLALKHGQLPPSLHFTEPNPQIDFDNSPFFINQHLREWQQTETPRRAGVSSFGIGGTNVHVVLEEAPAAESSGGSRPHQLLIVSAKSEAALESATSNLVRYLKENGEVALADIAYTLQVGRTAHDHRRSVVCTNHADAVSALGSLSPARVTTACRKAHEPSCVFMFSGQGAQYAGMGAELYRVERVFREQVDRCAELLRPSLGLDLREYLYPSPERMEEAAARLEQTALAQPALFVTEYALSRLWKSWGVQPAAMIGHSLGEYVAACLAGVFSVEDALMLVAARGRLMQRLPTGAMLAVALSEAELQRYLERYAELSLAAVNGSERCVVAGAVDAVEKLEGELTSAGADWRRLRTSHAFHSAMMEPVVATFTELVKRIELKPPRIPYVSNLTGDWSAAAEVTDPTYWAQHLRQTVRFADGLSLLLKARAEHVFLEVGPGRTLSALVKQHPERSGEQVALSSLPHHSQHESDVASMLGVLGGLWVAGKRPSWSKLYTDERRRRVTLPTYPFERERYWIEMKRNDRTASAVTGETAAAPVVEAVPAPASEFTPAAQTPATGVSRRGLERTVGRQLQLMSLQLDALRRRGQRRSKPSSGQPSSGNYANGSHANGAHANGQPEDADAHKLVALTPIQHLFFAQRLLNPSHWNQSVLLETPGDIDLAILNRALNILIERHDALRLRFTPSASGWRQACMAGGQQREVELIDLSARTEPELESAIEQAANRINAGLDITRGLLIRCALLRLGGGKSRLLIVIHHLAVDETSWSILLEDLQVAYRQLLVGEKAPLPPSPSISFCEWAERLSSSARSTELAAEADYWLAEARREVRSLPVDYHHGVNTEATTARLTGSLNEDETEMLLSRVTRKHGVMVSDLLLAALARALSVWTARRALLLDVEGHGREAIFPDVELSRTVGWFTSIYPQLLVVPTTPRASELVCEVKRQIRQVPRGGIGYGILRYLSEDEGLVSRLAALPQSQIVFNYTGMRRRSTADPLFKRAREARGAERPARESRRYLLEINGGVSNGCLRLTYHYSRNIHRQTTIQTFAQSAIDALRSFIYEEEAIPLGALPQASSQVA